VVDQACEGVAVAGTFELYTDASGKFRFRLKAGNGEIIASSEAYTSKAAAQNDFLFVVKRRVRECEARERHRFGGAAGWS
jgi:uncharacterized protein YegP (UPF0339 family)